MKRYYTLSTLILFVLTGCGGGGASSTSSESIDTTSTVSTPTTTTTPSVPAITTTTTPSVPATTTTTTPSVPVTSTPTTPTTMVITDDIQQCTLNEGFRELAIDIINQVRAESRDCGTARFAAADPVVWSYLLETAAVSHSDDMATNNFFSHTGSDGSSVGDRVSNAGYVWSRVAENISAGLRSMQDTINGLVNSPGHCTNIMNPNYVEMALACKESNASTYGVYWTQVFATQR